MEPKKNLVAFKDDHQGSPLDDTELAETIVDEMKQCALWSAANRFLEAQDAFYAALDKAEFERG